MMSESLATGTAAHSHLFQGMSRHTILLMILLVLQYCVFAFSPFDRKYVADEKYYVAKSRELVGDKGQTTEPRFVLRMRTMGYPVFIAAASVLDQKSTHIRYRIGFLQFCLMTSVLMVLYLVAVSVLGNSRRMIGVVFILAISPWAYGYSKTLYPDSLTASLLSLGLLGLFGFIRAEERKQSLMWLCLSMAIMSITILLRIEMAVLVPIFLLAAICLKHYRRIAPFFVVASLLSLGVLSFFVHQQLLSKGRVWKFGIQKKGAYQWIETWFATERTGLKHFLYGPLNMSKFQQLPDRAFGDDFERNQIRKAIETVEEKKRYNRTSDAIFRSVAEKRKMDNFWFNGIFPRTWSYMHIWMNAELNESLWSIAHRQDYLFIAVLFFFFLLKLVVFGLATFSVSNLLMRAWRGDLRWFDDLTILMLVCVIARTFLMGGMIGWVNRYALPAWPAMLWCALSALFVLNPARTNKELVAVNAQL